jgi:hypothetical protein
MTDHPILRDATYEEVFQHVAALGSPPLVARSAMLAGPLQSINPRFRVHSLPVEGGQYWIHVTAGAWEFEPAFSHREMFMLTRSYDLIFVEHLVMAAYYAATKRPLSLGDIVSLGRPLIEGSAMDEVLITLPYMYGPAFEELAASFGKTIRFMWLQPIHRDEAEFARSAGVEKLEEMFDAAGIGCSDEHRLSVLG